MRPARNSQIAEITECYAENKCMYINKWFDKEDKHSEGDRSEYNLAGGGVARVSFSLYTLSQPTRLASHPYHGVMCDMRGFRQAYIFLNLGVHDLCLRQF
jgi:hypothetical protein